MAIAVGFSSFVALTLGPVIASKILKTSESDSPMVQRVDRMSDALERRYQKSLKKLITDKLWAPAVLVISVLAVWALYQ